MGLSQIEKAVIEKARSVGNSELSVALTDEHCAFLCAQIIRDLKLASKMKTKVPANLPELFASVPSDEQIWTGCDFWKLAEELFGIQKDAITYFSCLAALQKGRLKYEMILRKQPFPTAEQIGPRGLLQFGSMSAKGIATFLSWRKWLYDIDNRAAQETGYLFEPIIAHAIGGIPVSAKKSPIRRHSDPNKGRQVDCITKKRAYEIKMRITIAASGQGRWKEELDFPVDCRESGFIPVLVVFDSTDNPKMREIAKAFQAQKGEVYIGEDAWAHLEEAAGETMATFLEKYVHAPIDALLEELVDCGETSLTLRRTNQQVEVIVDDERLLIPRAPNAGLADDAVLEDDVDDETPGI